MKTAAPKGSEKMAEKHKTCCLCSQKIVGSLTVGMGGARYAHSYCYEREHPPRTARTLYQVARGGGDPVLAAAVLHELIPAALADQIVDEFNRRLVKNYARRCQP